MFSADSFKLLPIALFTLAFAACGGGGGSSDSGDAQQPNPDGGGDNGPIDRTAPQVIAVSPENGDTDVDRNTVLTAEFSEAILITSVDQNSFSLKSGSRIINGTLGYDSLNDLATFTVDGQLSMGASYTATIAQSVSDLAGNPLAADFIWRFSSKDGQWQAEKQLDVNQPGDSSKPAVAVNQKGEAIALWRQTNGSPASIWSSNYSSAGGWSVPMAVAVSDAAEAESPQIVLDDAGNAVAVWVQGKDGEVKSIWANLFKNGKWGTATPIEADDRGDAEKPTIAMDGQGNVIAVWRQSDGTGFNIMSAGYRPADGWFSALPIESRDGDADSPHIAVNQNGVAMAVWTQKVGAWERVFANRRQSGSGWEGARQPIDKDSVSDAGPPRVAINDLGDAVVVWAESDGISSNIWANRFGSESDWETAGMIEANDFGNAFLPDVAVDSDGYAIAVWQQSGDQFGSIWSNRSNSAGEWEEADTIETQSGGASLAKVIMDSNGSAIAVWQQWEGVSASIYANRYLKGKGWQSEQAIEFGSSGTPSSPIPAITDSSEAVVIWSQFGGADYDIWVNRFE